MAYEFHAIKLKSAGPERPVYCRQQRKNSTPKSSTESRRVISIRTVLSGPGADHEQNKSSTVGSQSKCPEVPRFANGRIVRPSCAGASLLKAIGAGAMASARTRPHLADGCHGAQLQVGLNTYICVFLKKNWRLTSDFQKGRRVSRGKHR